VKKEDILAAAEKVATKISRFVFDSEE